MFSTSSSSIIGSEKQYDQKLKEVQNPKFVEHCQKLLLLSFLPEHPSFGLFQELENTLPCCSCHKQSFFVRNIEKTKKKEKESLVSSDEGEMISESYCVLCYVDKFCNVHTFQNHDGSETHYIFKEKGSSGSILYQSSSIIKRFASSSSE
jgi:hypothetical protein